MTVAIMNSIRSIPKRIAVIIGIAILGLTGVQQYLISGPTIKPIMLELSNASAEAQAAISEALKVAQREPRTAGHWGTLGMVLLAHQYDTGASTAFQNAVALDPGEFRWHYLLGLSEIGTNREEAVAALLKSQQISPQNWLPAARLGEIYLGDAALAKAEEQIQRARQSAPREIRPTILEMRLLLAKNEPRQALDLSQTLQNAGVEVREVYELKAQSLYLLGQLEDSREILNLLERRAPPPTGWNDPYAAQVLTWSTDPEDILPEAKSLAGMGNFDRAISLLAGRSELLMRSREYGLVLARLLIETGQHDQAGQVLQSTIQKYGDSAETQQLSGVRSFMMNELHEAEDHFRQSLRLKPDYALAACNLGQCLVAGGDNRGAIEAFELATQLAPEMTAARAGLIERLIVVGELTIAEKHIETMNKLEPGSPDLNRLQVLLQQAMSENSAEAIKDQN